MKILNIFFLFFLSSTIVRAHLKHCNDEAKFTKIYSQFISISGLKSSLRPWNLLGEGSFGKVYIINWGIDVAAVKVIDKMNDSYYSNMIDRELMFLGLVNGKKIAPELFACLETKNNVYIFQELMYNDLEAEDVYEALRGYSKGERLRMYGDLALKYQALHDLKITHQDIKPANIMALDKAVSELRIIDFGISYYLGEKVNGGTPTFNSFDKNKGSPRAIFYHDIYALAISLVILEENRSHQLKDLSRDCLKGKTKESDCEDEQIELIKDAMKHTEIPELEGIILKAISKTESYSSMEEMAEALESLADKLKIKDEFNMAVVANREKMKRDAEEAKKELAVILQSSINSKEESTKSVKAIEDLKTIFNDRAERAKNIGEPRKKFVRKGPNYVEPKESDEDSNGKKLISRKPLNLAIKPDEKIHYYPEEFRFIRKAEVEGNGRII